MYDIKLKVFTITAGRLKVNIHKDEFEVGIGTCFYVPPGMTCLFCIT